MLRRRALLQRALIATLFVSRGVPMLQGGDEIGRTQAGNNNAYCQDNALTWLDWPQADAELAAFTAGLIALRRRFPQLASRRWLSGEALQSGVRDVVWWHPAGREMRGEDWQAAHAHGLGFLLASEDKAAAGMLAAAAAARAPALLVLFNRGADALAFTLPPGRWLQLCDSSAPAPFARLARETQISVAALSVHLLSDEPEL